MSTHPLVATSGTHSLLLGFEFELKTDRVAQEAEIVLLGQPRREVPGLRAPNVPRFHARQPSE
jgi:hypothetical protein